MSPFYFLLFAFLLTEQLIVLIQSLFVNWKKSVKMRRRGPRRSNTATTRKPSAERRRSGPRRIPNKLFIGNLNSRVSKADIEHECARFGRLQDVWLSQKPVGFAFVEFLTSRDASACVQSLDGRRILGCKLRVEFAKTEAVVHARHRKKTPTRSSISNKLTSLSPLRARPQSPNGGLTGIMLSSVSTRLLPPPKPSTSMLAPVYDRSPSPLLLVRRGSNGELLYEDLTGCASWEDSARLSQIASSRLLPSRKRSHSPRRRSPLPLPPIGRDALSSGGRLLAPPLPPLPASFASASTSYVGLRGEYSPPVGRRYDSRGRSPARYRSRSPRGIRSRSRSGGVRAAVESRERQYPRSRSRSRTSVSRRPKERLLGKTPPLPCRHQSHSSPSPQRYGHIQTKSQGSPVSRSHIDRSASPLAYSSHPRAAGRSPSSLSGDGSTLPARKRLSPLPKAYSLSDRHCSPRWSRSRSLSVPSLSRSPVQRAASRSSSSTSPPPGRYGRSPVPRRCSPVAVKHEVVSRDPSPIRPPMSDMRRVQSPPSMQRRRSPSSLRRSPTPRRDSRDRHPVYRRDYSPVARKRSPSTHRNDVRQRSPSSRTNSGFPPASRRSPAARWSPARQPSSRDRRLSPPSSSGMSRNDRSSEYGRSEARTSRVHSTAVGGSRMLASPSRTSRSPRYRR